jgi:flagellar basal-body rod protein FlgC
VRVAGAQFGDAAGRLVSDPTNPLADANGMVKKPDMDLSDQITALIVAQRAYQANVTVFERARDAYQRALEIGK